MMMNKIKILLSIIAYSVKRNFTTEILIIRANCINVQYIKLCKQNKLCIFYIPMVILELHCPLCLPLATCGC